MHGHKITTTTTTTAAAAAANATTADHLHAKCERLREGNDSFPAF
jgi:hypothetical protein